MIHSLLKKTFQRFKTPAQTTSGGLPDAGADVFDLYDSTRSVPRGTFPCLAPWTSISFNIDGYATVCCLNRKTTIKVENNSIDDIWKSEAFKQLRENVSNKNLGHDCSICNDQIHAGNFTGVKAASYDNYFPYNPERPLFMEFCLENTCNLACGMCNSLLSSSIRKNEHLPPLKKHYGEKFVNELEAYIPYLKEAVFSGGEPFLIPIYYKIWEKMLAINPNITIGVVTNGSTLNEKIKSLLERGRFKINISTDSVHKETYEAIRRNASFDTLMSNFEWFKDYGNRKNLPVNLPVCPLTLNWDKIPEIVRFANKNDVSVNFVYVDRPFSMALPYRKPEYLENIITQYNLEKFDEVSPHSKNNIRRFQGLIDDIGKWRENSMRTAENELEGDLMQLLQTKIMESDEIPQMLEKESAKKEMILKIQDLLTEIPAEKHDMILKVFHNYSIARLHHFLEEKKTREIAVFFKEFVG
jgi:MoaA/NifB/PqqE/SkfB family radical SAM enzyme